MAQATVPRLRLGTAFIFKLKPSPAAASESLPIGERRRPLGRQG